MKAFVRDVAGLARAGAPFVLVTVVESSGSTPRSSGAKMAVRLDGTIIGTVGGGLAEARACRAAQEMLRSGVADGGARLMFVDMTQELAANSDMICGGGLSMLLELAASGGECACGYEELDGMLRKGVAATLTTRIEDGESPRVVGHDITEGRPVGDVPVFGRDGGSMVLAEPFIPPASLYIFGAGHVSRFTARVAAMVGFRTVVLDDREEFANRERFPEADEVVVLPSFAGCCDGFKDDAEAFVVIVTRGHLHDRNVLAEALRTKARYVGMIGSSTKRDQVYESLLSDGYTQADIDRCTSPIGLPLGGRTPEEIAVSIVGELIQVRAGKA
ncbi:putative xanthine dehydrogenase subunit A [Pseudodesulfovibrio hydrargyri]|uniref:Putative xanthine dehydrogenase subunit A n=1 Tax=Pseudodesulfovibrio hydrargyri TaxID=2125990 RepID=A0A1J5MZP5_9BACT|nr:XdhC/CoxI family protein [Pseudodesulfovibrio hydrargyri]OIQ51466.1 putative xanthine dehydrogenase subunit A [Pseudodesulfovibrio hydrargyri]